MSKNSIDCNDISFVVQGSIFDKLTTAKVLDSIRFNYPTSKIILSTWHGSDYSKLDYDKIILSKDISLYYRFYKDIDLINNINRQIVSTINGLKKVNTKYVVKIRTDIFLTNNNIINLFKKIKKNPKSNLLNSKIILPYDLSINPNDIQLVFHLNDFFIAGMTSDLIKLFDIPLMNKNDLRFFETSKNYQEKGAVDYSVYTFRNFFKNKIKVEYLKKNMISRFAPEQYIYKFIMLKNNAEDFNHGFIFNDNLRNIHNAFVKKNILFESSKKIGFLNLKYKLGLFTEREGHYTNFQIFPPKNFLFKFDYQYFLFKIIKFFKLIILKISINLYIFLKDIENKK